jgi:integrase
MRVNEALGLDRGDVDLERGIFHIRRTKFTSRTLYHKVHYKASHLEERWHK